MVVFVYDLPEHPLKVWRMERGLTQKEAADEAGVTQGVWSRWELGHGPAHPKMFLKIRETTGITRAAILRWKNRRAVAAAAENGAAA